MKYSKSKNPILPPVKPIQEVVSRVIQDQKGKLTSGTFMGTESSSIPKGGWRGTESSSIPKGGWRIVTPVLRDVYRTTTGHLFEFAFYLVRDRHYEIDILSMPDYATRDTGFHPTHRLKSNHGNDTRICFGDDSSASTLEDAQKWAATWSEKTIQYIKFGTAFPNE